MTPERVPHSDLRLLELEAITRWMNAWLTQRLTGILAPSLRPANLDVLSRQPGCAESDSEQGVHPARRSHRRHRAAESQLQSGECGGGGRRRPRVDYCYGKHELELDREYGGCLDPHGVISGASGTGNGTINYSVDVNTGLLRQGSISITPSGQPAQAFTITQAAGTLSFIPTSASPSGSSTTGSISVTATAGLAWTAAAGSGSTWVSITSGASGTGNGTIGYSIQGNPTWSSRQGTIVITPSGEAAQTFTITQATATFSFTPASASIVVGGGTGSVAVTATSAVNWTAVSNATAWVQITSGASGTGNGTINYSVSANTTASSRQTTITITPSGAAAQVFTITEAPLLSLSFSPTSASPSGSSTYLARSR